MTSPVLDNDIYGEIKLQAFKTVTKRYISDEMLAEAILANSIISVEYVAAMNAHVVYLKTMIAGCDRKIVEYVEYKSWWDMFKDTKFPEWLKKRFPPVKHNVIVNAREIVPSLVIPKHKTYMSLYVKR